MRRRKIEGQIERQLLIAMIVNKEFLSQAHSVLENELYGLKEGPLFRQIADWCVVYFQEYGAAPGMHIEAMYGTWADQSPDQEVADSIHDLLEDLSGQYETAADQNVPFLLDKLSEHLTDKKLNHLSETLDSHMSQGDRDGAVAVVESYRGVELSGATGVDPFNDTDAWERTFSASASPLIHFKGDAGLFLNAALTRDALVAIQAPEKRGKTWWCLEFVVRALQERRKVALFEVGDLSEAQVMMRLGVRFAGAPMSRRFCGEIQIPHSLTRDEEEEIDVSVDFKTVNIKDPITLQSVARGRKRFLRQCAIPEGKTYLKISTHANSSINVKGIASILDRWGYEEGFLPDVIIIDYADILAPEEKLKDFRHQTNETWKALRKLSQDRHALVMSPTQADAASYGAHTQGMKNFSEDKRKLAHVTGMLALNQTAEEKEQQVMRLNWIVLRESPFNPNRCLYVGNCFALGRALVCATM